LVNAGGGITPFSSMTADRVSVMVWRMPMFRGAKVRNPKSEIRNPKPEIRNGVGYRVASACWWQVRETPVPLDLAINHQPRGACAALKTGVLP
jgi:hypothetical protein